MRAEAAMVFAAGRGTRMRALTAEQPKPMIEVAGRPLIDHALDLVSGHGIARAVVNLHHKPDPLLAHLARRHAPVVETAHEDVLLETGGGLKAAARKFGREAAVWTLNGDAVWDGPNPFGELGDHVPKSAARLLLVPRGRAVGHPGAGDFFRASDGRLRRRGGAVEAPFVYTGLQIIDPAVVAARPEDIFSLNPVWDDLMDSGDLTGLVYSGRWCDVGQPESIALAEAMLAGG